MKTSSVPTEGRRCNGMDDPNTSLFSPLFRLRVLFGTVQPFSCMERHDGKDGNTSSDTSGIVSRWLAHPLIKISINSYVGC